MQVIAAEGEQKVKGLALTKLYTSCDSPNDHASKIKILSAPGVQGAKRSRKCNPAKSSGVTGVRELKLDVGIDGIVPLILF